MTISSRFLRPLAFLGALLLQAAPSPGQVSRITLDENRHAILQVTLHSLARPSRARTFRFALDTGCELTVIDPSVPAEFFRIEPDTDPEGGENVTLNRVEVGGVVRDGVPALRTNLKTGSVGRFQDEPMDGILGQSFLRETRFTLDPGRGEVTWWPAAPAQGAVLPLIWSNGVPFLQATLDTGQQVLCMVDTGSIHTVELPATVGRPGPALRQEVQHSFDGAPLPTQVYAIPSLHFAGGTMRNVDVEIARGTRIGNLGQSVWLASPTTFDFRNDRIIVGQGPDGTIPTLPRAPRSLPVAWDRTQAHPTLTVVYVVPGSPLALAGAQRGDEIVRAGKLTGANLSRRVLMRLLETPGPCSWTVRRYGKDLLELNFD